MQNNANVMRDTAFAHAADGTQQDIADDPDFRDIPSDWSAAAQAVMPVAKQAVSIRLDPDVIGWFRAQGPGYQTRINAVLRAFVAQQTR
jgi:uncharacterized protein (DUF4415 family)